MASVKKDDIPETAKFMSVLWDLVKEFYIQEDTDAYWNAYRDKTDMVAEQFKNDPLVLQMLFALTNYLEVKMKGRKPKA
jgi:hypothetical protein